MSSNDIVSLISPSNDIDLASKYYFNNYDDNNFKKRTYKSFRRRI